MLGCVKNAERADLVVSRVQALVRAWAGRGDVISEDLGVEHVLARAVLLVEQLQVTLRQLAILCLIALLLVCVQLVFCCLLVLQIAVLFLLLYLVMTSREFKLRVV